MEATINASKSGAALTRETFPVLEMTCAACAVSVESMLRSTEGVKDVSVNFANQTASVTYDPKTTAPAELQNVVRSIGYDLVVNVEDPNKVLEEAQKNNYQKIKSRTIWSLLLAIPVVILGMFLMEMPYANHISLVLSAPVIFYFGGHYFQNAWKQAKHGKANMDTLVALSTGIAFLFSAANTFFPEYWHERGLHAHVYFESAVVVIAFISLGKLLEERAKTGTSAAIKKLMGLQAKTVHVISNGVETEVAIEHVKKGDVVVVKPGEKIPVDGTLVNGTSYVDESMISGEPIAVEKKQGAKVFAGTINQKGSFTFEAQQIGNDTVLANIIRMVQQAQGSKAPVQKLVDKIAGIFVPVVIIIAMLTFVAWLILGGDNVLTHAMLSAITVLVIACPCALGLATPTAIMVGVGRGAENNILIKDAESLEIAHKVNVVVLDKTGTITEGKPATTDFVWRTELDKARYESVLLALESRSEHPLAEAVVSTINKNINQQQLDTFESITARGVTGTVNGVSYYVGNEKLLNERSISVSDHLSTTAANLLSQSKTVVYFADAKDVLAVIGITDKIKATSKAAIATLQKRGVDVYMLTGDNEQTAKSVAGEVGLKHYVAGMLPSEKATFIEALQAKGKIVAMVGDGINDSQALAQADISIAMGKGSDIAMDVAKMTLITSDLQSIPKALNLSHKTVMGIRQNLFWAFIYNLIGIPLAAGVLYPVNGFLLNPMIAGAAMALSSVSVVLNSLRLRTTKI